jgi:uncharacterized protein
MESKNASNIFIIPYGRSKFIIYLPVHGILFKANAAAVNQFYNALNGDKLALSQFGLTSRQVKSIHQHEENRFSNLKSETRFNPTSVSLFLTTDCSMKCVYCYASSGEKKSQIRKGYIEVAVNEIITNALLLKKNSISVHYHGGGDIGVVWDLVEQTTDFISKKATENKLNLIINIGTNGVLNDYQRDWVVKNINSATVSIDGMPDTQNRLRPLKNGRPSFDIVHDTLKYFDIHDFNYAVRTTVTAETINELERSVSFFCENYKVRKIKIEPVFIQGRAPLNNVNSPQAKDFIKYFTSSQKIAKRYNKELLYSGARFDTLSNYFCLAAGNSFCVTPDGYITSCYEVLDKSNPVSDTFFYGRINNGKIQIDQAKLNKLASIRVNSIERCNNCFAKFHCAGDCPVKTALSLDDAELRNYRCFINRELTKKQLLNSIL